MAEFKDGKFIFTDEEQKAFDKIIEERVLRESKKTDGVKAQLAEAIEAKDLANAELNKNLKIIEDLNKSTDTLKTQLKNAGIETDNLKTFVKNYQTLTEKLKNYEETEILAKRKTAFVEAGGDVAKFDKAIKLVDFKDGVDPKDIFTELLSDDSWSILKAQVTPDPNAGGNKPGDKGQEDEESLMSKEWANILFPKKKE